MIIEAVGVIKFDSVSIDVYGDINEPLFIARDVAKLIGYRVDNTNHLVEDLCESDEYLRVSVVRSGQKRLVLAVTEMGLYNILSQSRLDSARKWRRIIHTELINMRKEDNRSISEQFEIWDNMANDIWFDEETGKMMEAINDPRGDVIVREFEPES